MFTSLNSSLNMIELQGMIRLLIPCLVSLIYFEFETELFRKVDVTTDTVYSQSLQQLDPTETESSTGK